MVMNKTFKSALVLAGLAVLAIAVFDILAAHSGVFGTYADYTTGDYSPGWWPLFFKTNIILLSIIPISYYIFGRKDKSEAIALFVASYILWFSGLADIFYFLLQGKAVPATLPWLQHGFMATVASLMGQTMVTNTVLFVSAGIGVVAAYGVAHYLEKVN